MSRSQKVVLISLVVLLLLFVLVMVWGNTRPACASTSTSAQCEPGSGMALLGSVTAPLATGMQLPQKSYAVPNGATVNVNIAATSDKMRRLELRLTEGNTAFVSLYNNTPDAKPKDGSAPKQTDQNPLPNNDAVAAKRRTQLFIVTGTGATLSMRCTSAPRCTFAAE